MLLYNSGQKDRNYHRSKTKLFSHEKAKGSKQKNFFQANQVNDVTINVHMRAKSPTKQQRNGRSPSKGSKRSKNSLFSDRDKLMTRHVEMHRIEYNCEIANERRGFRSPTENDLSAQRRKQRVSEETRRIHLMRSKQGQQQGQKQEPTRRKQRYPRLFQVNIQKPKRIPPRSPRNIFMQEQGQIFTSQKQVQHVEELREQNQFYKLIYKASLQKMRRLERSIEKEKEDYMRTKEQFDRELRSLKWKINRADNRMPIGHIYSYEQKDVLKIKPENIIPETDNQLSEITKNNQINEIRRIKDHLPSRLSLDSII